MVPTLAESSRSPRPPRTPGTAPRRPGSAATGSARAPRDTAAAPVRVGIVDECELVRRGLAGMLEAHRHRIQLVRSPRLRDEVGPAVDVVLYDPSVLPAATCAEVERLARRRGARPVVFTWDPDGSAADGAAAPVLSKCWDAEEMVARLEQVADRDAGPPGRASAPSRASGPTGPVPSPAPGGAPAAPQPRGRRSRLLPGGLTEREAQIVDLISRGLSNDEVARACYLSINSIKTYIRTAYRKMGVTRRSQAVVWGLEHGLGGPESPVAPVPGLPAVPGQRGGGAAD